MLACDDSIQADAVTLGGRLGVPVLTAQRLYFPSTGEWSSWAPAIPSSSRVLMIASMRDDVHVGLLIAAQIAAGLQKQGVREISLLVPLLPYARSDRPASDLAARGIDVFVETLLRAGITTVITLDLHSPPQGELEEALVSLPTVDPLMRAVTAAQVVATTVILPDRGALARVGDDLAAFTIVTVDKQRISDSEVAITFVGDARIVGSVLIFDDALFTGMTHAAVAARAIQLGASEVHLAVTHALPTPGALDALASAGVSSLTHLATTPWQNRSPLTVRSTRWSERIDLQVFT